MMKVVTPLLLASVVAVTGCTNDADCDEYTCGVDIAAGRATNGKTFTKCYGVAQDGKITTTIDDDHGSQIYKCTDPDGGTCTERTVNAEFAYCAVR